VGEPAVAAVGPLPGGLDLLFAQRSIAVVGASRNPAKLGAVMARSLRGQSHTGALATPTSPRCARSGVPARSAARP
jgi:acetyltransferase